MNVDLHSSQFGLHCLEFVSKHLLLLILLVKVAETDFAFLKGASNILVLVNSKCHSLVLQSK